MPEPAEPLSKDDAELMSLIYQKYYGNIKRSVLMLVSGPDVEDIVQDTIVRMMQTIDNWRSLCESQMYSYSHGGIFCRLMDGCTVVCKYAQQFTDSEFKPGDRVVVLIRSYDNAHHWIRGKIRAKLG